jgi:hypothetical protein
MKRLAYVGTRTAAVVAMASLIALSAVRATTLEGVSFPDQATVGEKTLVLNGLGLRTATILKVKVYVIGLYLEEKSSDANAIIESKQSKRLAMQFVHDVTADKLRSGWEEGFKDNYKDVGSIEGEIAQFNATMQDVKEGDSIELDFSGDIVDIMVKGAKADSVDGSAFQQALLAIWLGPKPPGDALKDGLLGR